jgi:hypothetical protein
MGVRKNAEASLPSHEIRAKKIPQARRLGGLLGINLLFVLVRFVEVNHLNSVVALTNNAVKLC